ncbi:homoserine O-acetyltransferase-like protein [Thermothielavioides terrestris NRRL 8126]|uniref:Homoserine O-acetyltransferase-like protein n=1 Tax=Thermothielavioides terrestris (strain ATCC 38088 / NRRL 8126) TaxID=578455 RepID=G2R016_THETT|nr:homoserine O-acetyltransferase-like protein [Thermothielavioides terrestris NRRL 8126]AEO65587.1 homoserine O-acetyltransferase-like protein [Thermothielavioides terrestris NRRL 8126]
MRSRGLASSLRHASTAVSRAASPRTRPFSSNAPPPALREQAPGRNSAPSNPAIEFPCLDVLETRSATLQKQVFARSDESGPEPSYTVGATQIYHCREPLILDHGGRLQEFDIAYETWGQMNPDRSNVILLHTGLSASSHAHSTPDNPQPGWWEKFIGPGLALDTDKYFVICTNVIGGCYGSTGPSSIDPSDGKRYATRFPILTIQDMVRAQFRLLDHLGVSKLYASVGSSMGGMQSLAAGVEFPSRVGRIVSISACARSHPYSIAMRYVQRRAIVNDPNWNRGFYYGRVPPHVGMKLAREIATITYRSGPEWEQRFGRRRADPSQPPALCPDFLVETYLDHAGEKFCLTYDPNSLIYVSKAMDLFDLGAANQARTAARRAARLSGAALSSSSSSSDPICNLTLPDKPYEEQPESTLPSDPDAELLAPPPPSQLPQQQRQPQPQQPPADLVAGLAGLREHPVLVMGVASDILFPAWQQREVAEALRRAAAAAGVEPRVEHHELSEEQSLFGHDTFLLDVENVGGAVRRFLG